MTRKLRSPLSQVGAVALALLVTALWSSSWVLVRVGLDDEGLRPLTFAGIRYGIAAIVIVITVLFTRGQSEFRGLTHDRIRQLAILGLVWFGVTQGAQFVAIDSQPAATSSLVLSMSPLLVALLSRRLTGEAPRRSQMLAVIVVIVGAGVYFMGGLGATVLGMIAAVVALVANSVGSIMGRNVNRDSGLGAGVVTAISMAVGASTLLAVGISVEGLPHLSLKAWMIVVWLAVVNSALAFTLWNKALQVLSATESAIINNALLPQIALLGWIFLGESLGLNEAIGVMLTVVGLYFGQRR